MTAAAPDTPAAGEDAATALAVLDMAARDAGVTLPQPFAHPRWERVLALLATFNAQTNLVGAADPRSVCEDHLSETVALMAALDDVNLPPGDVVDVGAGAGLEALALAWCLPTASVVALEPRRKRAGFIRLAADALGVAPRLSVEEQTLTVFCRVPRRPCALATSRAVFPPARWLAEASGLQPALIAAHASSATRAAFLADGAVADGWRQREGRPVPGRADRVVLLFDREPA